MPTPPRRSKNRPPRRPHRPADVGSRLAAARRAWEPDLLSEVNLEDYDREHEKHCSECARNRKERLEEGALAIAVERARESAVKEDEWVVARPAIVPDEDEGEREVKREVSRPRAAQLITIVALVALALILWRMAAWLG